MRFIQVLFGFLGQVCAMVGLGCVILGSGGFYCLAVIFATLCFRCLPPD